VAVPAGPVLGGPVLAGEPPAAALAEPAFVAEGADIPDIEVDALEIHLRAAPAWRRALAWVVDGAPFAAGIAWGATAGGPAAPGSPLPFGGPFTVYALALAAILAFVYEVLSLALAGATLGKWLARLRVVGPDGRRPSFARSAARTVFTGVSLSLLGLGLLLALFTERGRALHDVAAGTWVVDSP
jgi:uncharacterized RDD family membrane protein YckC